MISALKKKFIVNENVIPIGPIGGGNVIPVNNLNLNRTTNTRSPLKIPTSGGIQLVSAELQKKFSHGVNFNMRVVIRGDRNTGKTCLWKRLQGKLFEEEYNPTDEIQVANINWNYRTFDHIVKLDIWDVVDEGHKKKKQANPFLKLDNLPSSEASATAFEMFENAACDATIVDVYKNCNGVLLIFDITKSWTWNYVKRELEKIPSQIPVLIMANKMDLKAEIQVTTDECLLFLKDYNRKLPSNSRLIAPIRFVQSSMKTALGLKFLYNFFNVPFLFLQREYLENALEANYKELCIAQDELNLYDELEENLFRFFFIIYYFYWKFFMHEPRQASKTPGYAKFSENGINSDQTQSSNTIEKTNLIGIQNYAPNKAENTKEISNASDSSEEQNHMVDMFEEDFDSNDELQKSMERSKNSTTNLPLDSLKSKISGNEDNEQEFIKEKSNITPSNLHLKLLETNISVRSEDSTSPVNANPLVSQFLEGDSDSSEYNNSPSLASYTIESSTSCSTTGFTYISPSTTKNDDKLGLTSKERKKSSKKSLISSSSTLTSISSSRIKPQDDLNQTPNNSKSTIKKKRSKVDDKKRNGKKEENSSLKNNFLEEDNESGNLKGGYSPL